MVMAAGNGFEVTHFTDQYDIRVFTQARAQVLPKSIGIVVDFTLDNHRFLRFVGKFNRVFNGNNVVRLFMLILIDHCGQRGRFTGTGRAGHQHQTTRVFGKSY